MSERVDDKGRTLEEFLAEYDMTRYPRPSVTLDNVVLTELDGKKAVLLIRRRNHPFIGEWAFPGGFLDMDEDLHEGAARELREETGVTGVIPKQLGAYGRPGRDPRGRIVTVAFVSELPEGAVPAAADDAADAALFTIDALPDGRTLLLTHTATGETLAVPYSFREGRAEFIPVPGFAGDHPQILADALMSLDLI